MKTESTISRRALLAGFAAAGAGATGARAATPPATARVGAAEVRVVSDGHFTVPRGFVLPSTPPAEVDSLFRQNGAEPPPAFLTSPTNVTLVRSGDELILIDAGSGANFQPSAGKLSENLEAAGIDPAKIAKVVFTHAHADHLWGAIDDFNEPRFPNATYVIGAAEWDFWTDPSTVVRMPEALKGMAAGSARILKLLEPKIERRKAGDTVAPGLAYVDTSGHTPGHLAVMIESGGERLLVVGDVLGHALLSFQKPDWPMGSDTDREAGARRRRAVLDMLAAEHMPFIGFHLAFPGIGRVERNGTDYRFVAG